MIDYAITSNVIRSMWEMESESLFLRGNINAEERAAVRNINGHSSAVTRDFYLLNERIVDAQKVNAVTSLISPHLPSSSEPREPFRRRPSRPDMITTIIGCKHIDANRKGSNIRIKWSKEELCYIARWLLRFNETYAPDDRAKVAKVSL